jgi:hypothetical protein
MIKFIILLVNAIVLAYNSEFFLYEPILATIIVPNTGIVIKDDNNIYIKYVYALPAYIKNNYHRWSCVSWLAVLLIL